MRILHELNQLERGGAERIVESIIKHDKKNTHTVYSYKDGPMNEILKAAGANVIIESKETVDMDCDIIHVHTGGSPSLIASHVKGLLPVIETIHSPCVSAIRDEWIDSRVGVSDVVTKLNRKCRTIHNGIDLDRLKQNIENVSLREVLNIPKDALIIGRLGRIGKDKCLEEWILACKKFQDSGHGKDAHFLIVGDEAANARGYLAKVKVMAASIPLKNVHFVKGTEFAGWAYQSMDIFLYPSPTEGFGLVYMEAAACGVPCILWDSDLAKELMMGAAYLAPNTIDGLAEALSYLWANQDVRHSLGVQGKINALGYFTAEKMSENYQALYQEVIERAKVEGKLVAV